MVSHMTDIPPDDVPDEVLDRHDPFDAVRHYRRWFTLLGISLAVLGVLAFMFPLAASIAAKVLVGWVILLSGAALLYHAFQADRWRLRLWSGAIGLIYLITGVYLVFFPLTGLLTLTLLMGVLFVVQGLVELNIALAHRGSAGWGWLAGSAVMSIVLGLILVLGLPGTALWALGLLLGVNLIALGVAFFAMARAA